jgi:hypothetical protein
MTIDEVCTIGDALLYLSWLTKRAWSSSEFTHEVIRRRLPIYARAPWGASIVSRKWVDGRLVITPQPSMVAEYVTLLQDEIEELARSPGPQIITDRPAWLFGDLPYQSWEKIVAFRHGNHRVLGNREVDHGEWMGQSDEYFFSYPVQVTAETVLVVPRHTIAELALNTPAADSNTATVCGERVPAPPVLAVDGSAIQGNDGTEAAESHTPGMPSASVNEASSSFSASTRGRSTSTQQAPKQNIWDQHGLRRLLEESWLPGNTQAVLAKKYNVTPQFISKQLGKARDLHSVPKATPFDLLGGRSRKK